MTPQLIALTCAASLVLAVPSWAREIGPEGLESVPVVDVVVLGEDVGAIPEGLYPGDYLVPVGQALAATGGHVQFTLRFDGVLPDGAGIAEVMARPEYEMQVGLGRGTARAELFASDLGHGYVTVNAEYRT